MDSEQRSSRALLHAVARLRYENDLSQREIAKRLRTSTATVSRLIRRAHDEGIVRIKIEDYIGADELASELRGVLSLDHVVIADSAPAQSAMAALAHPVALLLEQASLGARSVLGLGWGRTVWEIIQGSLPKVRGITTVPLCGGIPEAAPQYQLGEITRLAAAQLEGTPKFLHVPYLLTDEARRALSSDPRINETLEHWNRLDAVIVGVGRPHGGGEYVSSEVALTPNDPSIDHAVGDVLLRYFDARGERVFWAAEHTLCAIEPEQLLRVPLRIGAAVSEDKAIGIVGAVRSGFINALVTDNNTASHVLHIALQG